MKTIGIIGGIGPESTIEYYRQIIALYREQKRDGSYPSIIINSIDMKRMLDLIEAHKLDGLTKYLLGEVKRLAHAGADLGLLASNTPHIVFEDIQKQSPIPLISIVKAACEATKALGITKVGLLGTRFTMLRAVLCQGLCRAGDRNRRARPGGARIYPRQVHGRAGQRNLSG